MSIDPMSVLVISWAVADKMTVGRVYKVTYIDGNHVIDGASPEITAFLIYKGWDEVERFMFEDTTNKPLGRIGVIHIDGVM